ncbi:DNA-binding helix-turn-helix protein, partial [Burkholderia multivorans ATCC BAA-247]
MHRVGSRRPAAAAFAHSTRGAAAAADPRCAGRRLSAAVPLRGAASTFQPGPKHRMPAAPTLRIIPRRETTMSDHDDHHFPGLNRIGALLADPGRAAMLWALMDGSARPAGELTMIAGLSPSAASAHLARLTEGGLLALEVRGRHRYFRLASADIAASLEALANVARAAADVS